METQTSQAIPIRRKLSYHNLMQFRIHEILIVSSLYDAFKLEEDGRLGELLFTEYQDMNLSSPPRVTRVSTAQHALERLSQIRYDLIITMARIADMNPYRFGRLVQERYPGIPVILLAANAREHEWIRSQSSSEEGIDKVFYWMGDSALFTAINKYIEDRRNAPRDILQGGARAIIVVEDSPRFYSLFLPAIYRIIIKTTYNLMKKEYTDELRMYRMRSRPKILLASTFEEALEFYEKYQNNILAVISDVRYPRHKQMDPQSGIRFLKIVSQRTPSVPMMLQSMDRENITLAREVNAYFLDKGSPQLVQRLREFVINHCGFGDLIFSSPDKREIARARDLRELEEALKVVPAQSIWYHARRDHFSNWLAVRGYFELADVLKPLQVDDFEDWEQLRDTILDLVHQQRISQYKTTIAYFDPEAYDPEIRYVRFGGGSLGGKARGLAFLISHIQRFDFVGRYPNINISIPNFAVIGTEIYDDFVERNHLGEKLLGVSTNQEIDELFLAGTFDEEFTSLIRTYLSFHKAPLAVRSSSLLEDSLFEPFAGVYSTFMLPNNAEDLDLRTKQLLDAIKLVYASTYHMEAQAYMQSTGNRPEDEKMGVVVQHLIGKRYGNVFYPSFAGIVQSHNYYPQDRMRREDGLATVALGLGRTVVSGEKALRFCPRMPEVLPQFFDEKSIIRNSQSHFWALSMENPENIDLTTGETSTLVRLDLREAEKHGTLELVGSVYSFDDRNFRESLMEPGPRVVTFANILKWRVFPLAEILRDVIHMGKVGMGCDVEVEFAANVSLNRKEPAEFYLLQIRPMVSYERRELPDADHIPKHRFLCQSDICLGHGINRTIRDLVFVKPDAFEVKYTEQIVSEIRELNQYLGADKPYLLIGPGRWGSADPLLGIPVKWNDISFVRCIVEVGLPDFYVDPSFGSHFFQNITSLGLAYFTVPPKYYNTHIDWEWLNNAPVASESRFLKHLHSDDPFFIQIDGHKGRGVILKPRKVN